MASAVLTGAVDIARDAAVEAAGDASAVGEHLGTSETDTGLVAHRFAADVPGYRGWQWDVVVAAVPRSKSVGVCEAHLVPAEEALLAPAWVPWAERVRPGDLDAHMVLPYQKEDPRIVPGYEATGEDDEDAVALWELGLGRERVLGVTGRDSAAERWYRGDNGPTSPAASQSAQPCATCAFLVPMGGSMRGMFGVCANEWSPSDGQVVSLDHGCGAHSETDLEKQSSRWPADAPVVDSLGGEFVNADDVPDDGPTQEPAGDAESDAPEAEAPATEPAEAAPAEAEAAEPDSQQSAAPESGDDEPDKTAG